MIKLKMVNDKMKSDNMVMKSDNMVKKMITIDNRNGLLKMEKCDNKKRWRERESAREREERRGGNEIITCPNMGE